MLEATDASSAGGLVEPQDLLSRIGALMRSASMEATRPDAADAQLLATLLPPGADIFLSAVPRRPLDEIVEAARLIHAVGLTPVPHVAARAHASLTAARDHVARLRDVAGVRAVLVIGGDRMEPAGEIADAGEIIQSGILPSLGIARVGIAGHPDGHPKISGEELESALVTKIAAAQSSGLDVEIVTQFGFDPALIIRWIEWLRARGVNLPVRVGLAGPTSLMTWLGYARRCGVRASAEALARRSGLVRHAFHTVAPDAIIRALVEAQASKGLGEVSPHLYSFGGIGPTARWIAGAARGTVTLEKEGGFHIEPWSGAR